MKHKKHKAISHKVVSHSSGVTSFTAKGNELLTSKAPALTNKNAHGSLSVEKPAHETDHTLIDNKGIAPVQTTTIDVAPVAAAAALTPSPSDLPPNVARVGNEFTANGITQGGEFFSSVATFSDGGYIVAYTDTSYTDGEENAGIRARIFDKDGNGGADIHVNTTVAGGQYKPQIGILNSGNFVITWTDEGPNDGSPDGDTVRAQMYTRDGKPMGAEFVVNTTVAGNQEEASITALSNGGFVIAWQDSNPSDGSGSSVKAQLFKADGTKSGGEIQLNTITKNDQSEVSITALADGGFVAVWQDDSFLNGDNTRDGSIKAQMFHADGSKAGGEILVDTKDFAYVNTAPSVIGLANGGFAAAWQGQSEHANLTPDTDDSNILLQIFNRKDDGTVEKVNTEIQVNTKGEQYQQAPKLVQLDNGYIVVVWEDIEDGTGDHGQIKGQIVDGTGKKIGGEFTVNGTTSDEQHSPAIAALSGGRFMVTWTDNSGVGTDTDDDSIRAQIFSVGGIAGTISDETLTGTTVNENSANGAVVGTVKGVDELPGAVLTFSLADSAGGRFAIDAKTGVITVANGSLIDFETAASYGIKVTVADQSGQSFTKGFNINVNNVNEAPTIDSLSGSEVVGDSKNGTVVGTVSATDPDAGDSLTFSLVNNNGAFAIDSHGVITVADSTKLVLGSDAITVRVSDRPDGTGLSVDKTFNITVDDPAKQPVAADEHRTVAEDVSVVIQASDLIKDSTNPTGATLSVSSIGQPQHGTVSVSKDASGKITSVTYTPDANFSGQDSITYTLTDANGRSSTATVSVDVNPVADAPALSVFQVPDLSANVTKVGNEFTANTTKVGGEFFSSVATFPDGGYVVAYTDTSYTDGEENAGIRAQIYDKDGNKVGKELHVNTTVAGGQYLPQITILANGNFVVAWNDEGENSGDTSGDAVRGQMYTSNGTKIGTEFVVNSSTDGNQEDASITALSDGGFLVAWTDANPNAQGDDTSGSSVKAQRYDAGGHKVGGEFLLNTTTSDDQSEVSVSALKGVNNGGFVATWKDMSLNDGIDTRDGGIRAQMFDASGHKIGGEIRVDTLGINYVNDVNSVVGLANGGFAVTWQAQSNFGPDTDDSDIQLQFFDKDGNKVNDEILVNNIDGDQYQQAPKITESNGFVIVTWENVKDGTGDHGQIQARVFDELGHPVTDEFTVNGIADGEQHTPAIAALPDGRFIITWTNTNTSVSTDKDDDGIQAQIFSIGGQAKPATLDITAALGDTDGSEVLALNISGIPVGVTISDGLHSFTATDAHTSVDVTGWAVQDLTVVKQGVPGDVTLTVTATSTDSAMLSTGPATDSKTVSQTITLTNVGALPSLATNAAATSVSGTSGNDVLSGHSGNDVLTGGGGNDTYQFSRGGGQDTIVNGTPASTAPTGELDFGAGISANQLWFQRNGNDLSIAVMGSHDQVTLAGWFGGAGAQLAEITTADGMKIDAGVSQLVQAMATYSSAHAGFDPASATQAPNDAGLQNAIAATWHH